MESLKESLWNGFVVYVLNGNQCCLMVNFKGHGFDSRCGQLYFKTTFRKLLYSGAHRYTLFGSSGQSLRPLNGLEIDVERSPNENN